MTESTLSLYTPSSAGGDGASEPGVGRGVKAGGAHQPYAGLSVKMNQIDIPENYPEGKVITAFSLALSEEENVKMRPRKKVELKPGDLIEIFRSSCQHWAIYVGDRKVVHLASECEHFGDEAPKLLVVLSNQAYVRKDWLEDVVRNDRYRVNNKHDETHPPLPLAKILWQTEELVGKQMPYNLTSQNSEHFVMELRYGAEMHEQVELKPGDLIEIFRSSCQHWAIYVGNRRVVHLATECEHFGDGVPNTLAVLSDQAYVRKDWLEDVVRKDRYRVNNKHDETHPPLPLARILWQTEELVGEEMPYSLTSQNSEHFVMELRYGAEMKEQVELKPGDLIEIFRSSCQHWAIYVGNRRVVHLASECEHFGDGAPNTLAVLSDQAYVRKDWLEDVVRKDGYRVNNKHDETHPPLPLAKILWQTEELVDEEMPYSFTSQNSEHFVMELRYGAEMHEQDEIKPGDLIEIFRSCYQHWAIYVGEGKVVHLAPQCDRPANGAASIREILSDRVYVKKDWLDIVVRKDEYRVNNKHDHTHPPLPLAKILGRAEELVGQEMPYNLISHNCEHFVMDLRYGVAMSDQVTEAIAVGTIGMMGVAAAMIRSVAKRFMHRYE